MDEATRDRLNKLNDEVSGAHNEVDVALESGEDARELAAGKMVEELSHRYKALLDSVTGPERDQIERGLGRRITDLRRSAAQLTQRAPGVKAATSRDFGGLPFIEQRTPGKSIVPERQAPSANRKLHVGGEVEAWCGKCKEMREHHIVAMVGDEPKQVLCQSCRSRHGFRTEPPARARGGATNAPQQQGASSMGARQQTAADREMQKRADAKRALQKELQDVVEPRPFDPKGRYKAGEIIVHPEHGRGKIENVLKSSLLVRFVEGLRPLNLS